MPAMIGSLWCLAYADADRGECSPVCPFNEDCLPVFLEIAAKLEEVLGGENHRTDS